MSGPLTCEDTGSRFPRLASRLDRRLVANSCVLHNQEAVMEPHDQAILPSVSTVVRLDEPVFLPRATQHGVVRTVGISEGERSAARHVTSRPVYTRRTSGSRHDVNAPGFLFLNVVTHQSAPFEGRFSGYTASVCHRMFPFSLICIAISDLPFKS